MYDWSFHDREENEMIFSISHQNPQMPLKEKIQTSKFRKHLKHVFKDSLITGFPQIAKSRARKDVILKVGVFIFCFLGFSYQTRDFLNYYFAYPVTVNVEESNPFEVTPPAFTFCNHNRIRRRAWCEGNDYRCESYFETNRFCEKFPRYCYYGFQLTEMKVPKTNYSYNFNWTEAEKFSPTRYDMFYTCSLKYGQLGKTASCKYRHVPFTRRNNDPSFCYTINSHLDQPDDKEDVYPNSLQISMGILTYPEDYMWHEDPVLIYASTHNSKQLINPYRGGYKLDGGKKYDGYISLTQIERLPPPYSTNCYDYIKSWKENNGSGPTTQAECIEYCNMASVLSKHDCIDELISISHSERLCAPKSFKTDQQEALPTTTDEIIKNCTQKCQPACFEKIYEVEYRKSENARKWCLRSYDIQHNYNYEYNENDSFIENCIVKDVRIHYSFRKFRLKRHIYQAKYNSVELFSYIGGYMGLWLGISLVSIFDLFDSLGRVLYFSVKKRKFKTSTIQ